jgi:Fanconi anemia group M protein
MEYFDLDLLEDSSIEKREYQEILYDRCKDESSMVVLPTGTGKTIVSLLITADRLEDGGKSLFLAPTKPLVEQQYQFYKENLKVDEDDIAVFTGEVRPHQRADLWDGKKIIMATPQVIENDLIDSRIDLSDVRHITFDECHRATGEYAYTFIAEIYDDEASEPLVTGLSASPASDKEDIISVCENLGITNVEVITEDMDCLSKYLHDTSVEKVEVTLDDEIYEIKELLEDYQKEVKVELKKSGVLNSARKDMSMGELLKAQRNVRNNMNGDDVDYNPYKAASKLAEAIKLDKAIQAVATMGIDAFLDYMEGIKNDFGGSNSNKASERMMKDNRVVKAMEIARDYDNIFPKLKKVRSNVAITKEMGGQSLIFTGSRDNVENVVSYLNEGGNISAHRFVGQADKDSNKGMSQSEQQRVLREFREGVYDVLVATSVAEEGLDIPQVDLVLFYEPTASEIQMVQRKGRTGRESSGEVKVLVGKGTRDNSYYYAALKKEDKMKNALKELKDMEKEIDKQISKNQSTIDEFDEDDELRIIADQRETSSSVVRELSKIMDTEVKTIEVGDYIISDDCVVERKSVDDFLDTLTGDDRSLFGQAVDMADAYRNVIYIIEGDQSELYSRNIHPNAVRGAIATLSTDFNASVLFTLDEEGTTSMLRSLAEREQEESDGEFSEHGSKDARTLEEHQEYVVSSLYDIGPIKSKRLLQEFGSIKDIVNSDVDELTEVEGIGEDTAESMVELFNSEY